MSEVVLVCSLALCVLEAVVGEPFGYISAMQNYNDIF